MTHLMLRPDDPWRENGDRPDIRGWRLVDAAGRELGRVETVIVDTSDDRVVAVLTGPNDRFDAAMLEVGDGILRVSHGVDLRQPAEDDEEAESFATFDESYRRHFETVYAGSGRTYEAYEHAYRFGREMAFTGDLVGLPFERAKDDLQAIYELRHRGRHFAEVRDAVRHGFDLGHQVHPHAIGALDRDVEELIGGGSMGPAEVRRKAGYQAELTSRQLKSSGR